MRLVTGAKMVMAFAILHFINALVLLGKTAETFKLAELQFLELSLQAKSRNYTLERVLVDQATGSTLFCVTTPTPVDDVVGGSTGTDTASTTCLFPSSLMRCDWIAEIFLESDTPERILSNIQNIPVDQIKPMCILDYVRFVDASVGGFKNIPTREFTMKSLLCALSQAMPTPPALNPSKAAQKLMFVEAVDVDGRDRCYFVNMLHKLPQSCWTQSTGVLSQWASRPFQYSSAININVAEMIIGLLADMTMHKKSETSSDESSNCTILDPTCGSGTFLAFAMEQGMLLEGCDCNLQCVKGTRENLNALFGEETVESRSYLQCHDSSTYWEGSGKTIDCVVANLPWGVNSIEYANENLLILKSIRARISAGIPCAFVTREPSDDMFLSGGFEVLGQAHVPQRGFVLPRGKKKNKGTLLEAQPRRNLCVVTIARSSTKLDNLP